MRNAGPLAGVRVLEIAGLGPAPFCSMLLADMGADVLRVGRIGGRDILNQRHDVLARGRRFAALDLKKPEAVETLLRLAGGADALIEGFRPGVMERLGLGPEICLARNPKLVYGRMTGWGQTGPLANTAGHDITYIALSGALHAIGLEAPVPPLNLVGDFGGGGMLLAFGVVCALLEAGRSGKGQVVDAAMTDGSALLMAMIYSLKGNGAWQDRRQDNLLDGGYPFYGTYRCADGKWLAIGPLEPQFHREFLDRLAIDDEDLRHPGDRSRWPELRRRLAAVLEERSRDEWCALFEGSDACVAPVLDLEEAPRHPHNRARGTFVRRDGVTQPAPAPRFSRTPPELAAKEEDTATDTAASLAAWGLSADDIAALRASGAIGP
ncbi:MAG: CoA transferase [Telmatospirillum sp.]|nr:CoA transferase [Telmatospirillum sp.]